jgi:hypothetical protein
MSEHPSAGGIPGHSILSAALCCLPWMLNNPRRQSKVLRVFQHCPSMATCNFTVQLQQRSMQNQQSPYYYKSNGFIPRYCPRPRRSTRPRSGKFVSVVWFRLPVQDPDNLDLFREAQHRIDAHSMTSDILALCTRILIPQPR